MTRAEFDAFCQTLTGATHVIQWGGASVWKVGGKIFAICSHWRAGETDRISFKCSDLSYRILTDLPGISPAPYLARAKWVLVETGEALDDEDTRAHITAAHEIIAGKLTRARRAELGLPVKSAARKATTGKPSRAGPGCA
ncbi:MmcQ/YjbR family DNA-binding protein [Stappia indica]|uniref:MmcQ/YjbR family DNA-binding protein n=1 Tax=Stappia indica TaxID=538381 RepID=UPI00296F1F91|nr:MmcQ/YjbR family DNA-binding protein [Stappia indica]